MRAAVRSLLKAREFTLVAVALIAIGIGANTAVFSIVDAALLRPLPFRDSSRLFMLAGATSCSAYRPPTRLPTRGSCCCSRRRRAQRSSSRLDARRASID